MSGMDGHMPTILKHVHVPQKNLSLFGANPLLMPLMRIGVCFDVWITCTHGHIFTKSLQALSPSPTCPIPHPIPHPWSYFVPFSYFMLLLSYVSVFCSTSLSLTFISSLHVSAWLPFSRTHSSTWFPPTNPHKFPVFIPHRPPFHYTCPTNYSSVIPQFSQLQHSPHSTAFSYSHAYHRTPSCFPTHTKKKHKKEKTPTAMGSKYPLKIIICTVPTPWKLNYS